MKKITAWGIIIGVMLMGAVAVYAQDPEQKKTAGETDKKQEKLKQGWSFGALPALSYDTDLGLNYGAIVNLYDYGDGTIYPNYRHSIYVEVSRYTKGSGLNRLYYDSRYLIPGIRLTADLSYLTEKTLDFYGFNGYRSAYNSAWEDDESDGYISRAFYRHDRRFFRLKADFQGRLLTDHLNWIAGIGLYDFGIGSVDLAKLNKGKDEADMLPDIPGLYDRYVSWGIIPAGESDGGFLNVLKLGLIYDTRDNEPNPMSGIWTEAVLTSAPTFLGSEQAYTRLTFTHRQYFTLVPRDLSLACRVGYQGTVSGRCPFYMLPMMTTSVLTGATTEGLGGAKSLRGILRNRIVGDAFVYGNFELRWKFIRTVLFNQNIYVALNVFADVGKTVKAVPFDREQAAATAAEEDPSFRMDDYFPAADEAFHLGYGAGVRLALNENFILALDYGFAKDARDGGQGFYMGLNYLF